MVSDQTVLEAVWAVSGQKHMKLVEKVINLYGALNHSEKFVHVVRALAMEREFASACRLAIVLKLFTQFKKEEFILPLFIQDRISLAEDYLVHNPAMQKEVLQFLDKYLDYPRDMVSELS